MTKNKDATIGILLRGNYQVATWTQFVNDAGFKSITRSESLGQKAVFNTIFAILKYLQIPFDNEALVSVYEILSDNGFYKPRLQLEIRNSEIPFITKNGDDSSGCGWSTTPWRALFHGQCPHFSGSYSSVQGFKRSTAKTVKGRKLGI